MPVAIGPQKNTPQERFLQSSADIAIMGGAAGGGKGQPLDGPVWTPWGVRFMGELSVGSKVLAANGRPTTVVRIHELGQRELYRVGFRDGSSLVTTDDHLWLTWKGHSRSRKKAKLRTTTQLAAGYRVPLCGPLTSHLARRRPLPIAAYDMGLLLGDGCFRGNSLTVSVHDPHIRQRTGLDLAENGPDHVVRGITPEMRRLGLMGLYSFQKFVPPEYLALPPAGRAELLRGYMDADGTVRKDGKITATTTSPALRNGIVLLAESLGYVVDWRSRVTHYEHDGERRDGRLSYRLRFKGPDPARLFSLPRKQARCREFQSLSRVVEFVEPAGQGKARCISVADPRGLYVAGDRPIVTHNTYASLLEPIRHIAHPGFGAVIFRRTSPQITAKGGLWEDAQEVYGPLGGTFKTSPNHEVVFPTAGAPRSAWPVVQFRHLQHLKNRLDWKGSQVPLFIFDQMEEFEEEQVWYMMSRNRSTCGVAPYMRGTVNPDADSWVADLISWWWDPKTGYPIPERSGVLRYFARVGERLIWGDTREDCIAAVRKLLPKGSKARISPKSLTFIAAKLEDNPILERIDPGYRATLEALPTVDRERLLHGNWLIRAKAGLVFNRSWFDFVEAWPQGTRKVRYWDKAGTPGGGDFTSGVLMVKGRPGEKHGCCIADRVSGQWGLEERERVMRQTAILDRETYGHVVYHIEQEPGSGGKDSAAMSVKNLAGFEVYARTVTGDKLTRAKPLAAQAEAGNVAMVIAPWNKEVLDNLHNFTGEDGGVDDDVDACSGAFNRLMLDPDWEGDVSIPAIRREAESWAM